MLSWRAVEGLGDVSTAQGEVSKGAQAGDHPVDASVRRHGWESSGCAGAAHVTADVTGRDSALGQIRSFCRRGLLTLAGVLHG